MDAIWDVILAVGVTIAGFGFCLIIASFGLDSREKSGDNKK